MKSRRLNTVALTWLHGGHQVAPQYRNSGLRAARASANAASTSPVRHAIPSSCRTAPAAVFGTTGDGSGLRPSQAATQAATTMHDKTLDRIARG